MAYRTSAERRHVRAQLAVRDNLVRTRTRIVLLAKTLVRRDGLRVRAGASQDVADHILDLPVSETLASELAPLFTVLAPLNVQITAADVALQTLLQDDPIIARLTTAPMIGPVTAAAVVATIDDITRFHSAHSFEAYLGLVPGEQSSGEKRRVGAITKQGNARVRWLLVEAAWRILRSKKPETAALRAWAEPIAARRGKRIAVVALARRLAGILYAMWRDEVPYDAAKIRAPASRVTTSIAPTG